MSLFGSLVGFVEKLDPDLQQNPIASAALGMLQPDSEHGGVDGIVQKLQDAGLGDQVASWIGPGHNLPITGDQLKEALGSDTMHKIADDLGLDHSEVAGQLAQILPTLIDKISSQGATPAADTDS